MQGVQILPNFKPSLSNLHHFGTQKHGTNWGLLEWSGVGGWSNWVMGTEEDTWYNQDWVLHASDESLNSTPKLIIHYV